MLVNAHILDSTQEAVKKESGVWACWLGTSSGVDAGALARVRRAVPRASAASTRFHTLPHIHRLRAVQYSHAGST